MVKRLLRHLGDLGRVGIILWGAVGAFAVIVTILGGEATLRTQGIYWPPLRGVLVAHCAPGPTPTPTPSAGVSRPPSPSVTPSASLPLKFLPAGELLTVVLKQADVGQIAGQAFDEGFGQADKDAMVEGGRQIAVCSSSAAIPGDVSDAPWHLYQTLLSGIGSQVLEFTTLDAARKLMTDITMAAQACALSPTNATLGEESVHLAGAGANQEVEAIFVRRANYVVEVMAFSFNDPHRSTWVVAGSKLALQRLDGALAAAPSA
jgi:hypothetical protein